MRKWKHILSLIHLWLYKINIWFIFLGKSFIFSFDWSSSVIVSSYGGRKDAIPVTWPLPVEPAHQGQLDSVRLKGLIEFRWAVILHNMCSFAVKINPLKNSMCMSVHIPQFYFHSLGYSAITHYPQLILNFTLLVESKSR